MLDQAEALRALFKDKVMCARPLTRSPRIYTVAVTSGKGGVGKTSIAVNLALLLARAGRNVRLIDADFGLSNAEVLLGVTPKYGLADVVHGRVEPADAWAEVRPGLRLMSSGSGLSEMADMDGMTGISMIGRVLNSASDDEVVIIDTAPGIAQSVVSVLTVADEVMMITNPEPTSITDTYAAIKVLISSSPDAEITLVANCCSNPSQASAVAKGLENICLRFLKRSFQRHEYLPRDSEVARAIQCQNPLVLSAAHSACASWMKKIAIKLDDRVRKREVGIEVPDMPDLVEV